MGCPPPPSPLTREQFEQKRKDYLLRKDLPKSRMNETQVWIMTYNQALIDIDTMLKEI